MGRVVEGDCLEVMRGMEENSVDAIVCDPPYELTSIVKRFGKKGSKAAKHGTDGRFSRLSKGFMGKTWDGTGIAMRPEVWQEALRVAKPGAYLLAFGGTRTFHRLACAIEDAGWILKDTLSWNYGSGFPKSHDVSKALDHKAGAEREIVGKGKPKKTASQCFHESGQNRVGAQKTFYGDPITPEAKQWEGFGTALKPAWEPVILAQKPLEGTYAENVLRWGCGALNIDACKIGTEKHIVHGKSTGDFQPGGGIAKKDYRQKQGRWPANFLLSHSVFCEKVGEKRVKSKAGGSHPYNWHGGDSGRGEMHAHWDSDGLETVEDWRCVPDCPVRMLDEQSGETKSNWRKGKAHGKSSIFGSGKASATETVDDAGGASRFFYCAKASRSERNAGLSAEHNLFMKREAKKSDHPTMKPIAIMRYLCRLVTPPGGVVLDPFAGSGSTGCAAVLEGFEFIGIEKEKGYAEIARARISHFSQGRA